MSGGHARHKPLILRSAITPCLAVLSLVVGACAAGSRSSLPPGVAPGAGTQEPPDGGGRPAGSDAGSPREGELAPRGPIVPPRLALLAGWMPLRTTGVDRFRETHPTYDGRGVLIAILDTGVDPDAPGLEITSTGEPKILDLRDFSGEGRVRLALVSPQGDSLRIGGRWVRGAGRLAASAVGERGWYGGLLRELDFGPPPAGDLNGNGSGHDEYAVVVVRGVSSWLAFVDLDGDRSLADEAPITDYLVGRRTFTFASETAEGERAARGGRARGPLGAALNVSERHGVPRIDVVVDNGGHGTHVAGVAAGWRIGDTDGLNGVAPGAQLLALKIANNSRGGVSTTGSILAAMDYALQFARARLRPVVLNLSFGVGNGREGRAVIDSAVNAFLARHPDVVFTVSAGNDGPGLSTVGFPGSADLALSVGATYSPAFTRLLRDRPVSAPEVLADFSARGGEVAKPDLVAPGIAFSSVPRWNVGDEVKAGTSFAAPHVAGLAALLISAAQQDARAWSSRGVRDALLSSAVSLDGGTPVEQGAGVPQIEQAWHYLRSQEPTPVVLVQALPMGGNTSSASAAFRRGGFSGSGDTLQTFRLRSTEPTSGTLRFRLASDASWVEAPPTAELEDGTGSVAIRYRPDRVAASDVAVASVHAWADGVKSSAPAFSLVTTVPFPWDLAQGPLVRQRRRISAGQVARHFVRVPQGAGGLAVRLSSDEGSPALAVFEPTGRPVPGDSGGGGPAESATKGLAGRSATDTTLYVRAEDVAPGVYEIVVAAPPDAPVVYGLRVETPAVAVAVSVRGDSVVVAAPEATIQAHLAGAERRWAARSHGSDVARTTILIPAWARTLEIDVAMRPEQWDRFTDLGVTLFDREGDRVGYDPLNYPTGRFRVAVDSVAGEEVVLELFPGLALASDTAVWRAEVAIRALASEPVPLSPSAPGVFLASSGKLEVPATWLRLVETVTRGHSPPASIRRVAVGGR